jgi:ankyrin repeat protein
MYSNYESLLIPLGAFYGQKEILEYLLSNCEANIYERTSDGKTALMLAVYNNHRAVVELLLGNGASVHDNDVNGATPLILVHYLPLSPSYKMIIGCSKRKQGDS